MSGRIAGAVLALLAAGCQAALDPADTPYETALVQRADVRDVVPATGEIVEPSGTAITVPVDAVVTAVPVTLGQRVSKGQLLALLAPRTPTTGPADAAADTAQARIARQLAANRYAKALASYAGIQQLESRGFIPRARLVAEQKDLESERLALAAADQRLAALTARQRQARRIEQASDRLVSPCDCVVDDINVAVGQAVGVDRTDAFYLTGGGGRLTIRARVAEQDLARVQAARTVRFGVDALPDRRFAAELVYLGNRAIRDGRFIYYIAHLRFVRPDPAIRAGMTAAVEFVNADSRNVVSAPVKALYFTPADYVPMMPPPVAAIWRQARTAKDRELALAMANGAEFGMLIGAGKRRVFVLSDGKPVRRLVRVGAETADVFEAASGLAVGDRIVLAAGPTR